ncbi:hypothetical protein Lfu02_32290 [Longispora fulva]|uniref:Uncharacterized protein n=1 Tax=Longispora fulva TaxID=619741 RepID=A0A8J7GJM3_9ACTN|nr:hypothetical protein [Longispora fulva]MBG6139361.1 hypothetical protein [Longispora fulva]GIG58857.1 hypothetical protein Lfu02_32290 [Longispora fulva]
MSFGERDQPTTPFGGVPGPRTEPPEVGMDLSSTAFDDHFAQLGQWAKEGWHWDDIESRVYDLFDIPDQHRPPD